MKWIPVTKELPLERHRGEKVVGDFIVSLTPRDKEDDKEVTVLRFNAEAMEWKYRFTDLHWVHENYEVKAWQPMPEPI